MWKGGEESGGRFLSFFFLTSSMMTEAKGYLVTIWGKNKK
jgi:hypothetical protein